MLLGLTVLATAASPFGLLPWKEVAAFGRVLHEMRLSIQELLPPWAVPARVWTVDVFWCAWAAVLAGFVYLIFTDARKNLFALLLAAGGLYLSTVAYRNIPLLVFLSAPLLASVLRAGRVSPYPFPPSTFLTTTAALVLSLWVVSGGFYRSMGNPYGFGIRESRRSYPVAFADFLRTSGFHGSIFTNAADGSYLEFHFPGIRLYGDSRVVDVPQVREYFSALRDPAHFRALQRREEFDAVMLPMAQSRAVIAALSRDRGWRLDYSDPGRSFFVKRQSPAGR